ncbi:hypothetical protein [Streptomyces sp. RFCAC02]|uniref:hypothetical protein n=1 Tax=Streptomyces sp. RFCAC02 TaxID=2499143 RepID=UPI00101EAF9A|nr:hypothetical protein [Streptomyces sp. RFCAC02]
MTAEQPNPFRAPAAAAGPYTPAQPVAAPGPVPPPPSVPPAGHGVPPQQNPYAPPAGPPFPPPGTRQAYPGAHGPGVPAPWPPPPPPRPANGFGVTALVLGFIAAACCWTYYGSPAALVCGVLAVVFGRLGLRRVVSGRADNRGIALGGLWAGAGGGAVALVLSVLLVIYGVPRVQVETEAGAAYLAGPAETVTFDDGMAVSFGTPRNQGADTAAEPGDATYEITATVANGTDHLVELDDDGINVLVGDNELPDQYYYREAAREDLAPGQTVRVRFMIEVPGETVVLGVDYRPSDDHEWAYWEFDLDGGDRSGTDDQGTDGDLDV